MTTKAGYLDSCNVLSFIGFTLVLTAESWTDHVSWKLQHENIFRKKKKHSHPFKLDDQTGGINLIWNLFLWNLFWLTLTVTHPFFFFRYVVNLWINIWMWCIKIVMRVNMACYLWFSFNPNTVIVMLSRFIDWEEETCDDSVSIFNLSMLAFVLILLS